MKFFIINYIISAVKSEKTTHHQSPNTVVSLVLDAVIRYKCASLDAKIPSSPL